MTGWNDPANLVLAWAIGLATVWWLGDMVRTFAERGSSMKELRTISRVIGRAFQWIAGVGLIIAALVSPTFPPGNRIIIILLGLILVQLNSRAGGTLRNLSSGQWAIQAPGLEPVPIVAGEVFLLGVRKRKILRVRMEQSYAVVSGGRGERRVELRDGLRAGFHDHRERYAKMIS